MNGKSRADFIHTRRIKLVINEIRMYPSEFQIPPVTHTLPLHLRVISHERYARNESIKPLQSGVSDDTFFNRDLLMERHEPLA